MAKHALFPISKLQKDLADDCQITENADSEQHSAWLREYFQRNDADSDFRVQLVLNLDEQNVEDCSVEWNEEKYSFETVARVVLPNGHEAFNAQRRVIWEYHMKLSMVWHRRTQAIGQFEQAEEIAISTSRCSEE